MALPDQEFSLDVVLRVGHLRYREHRSRAEIRQQLLREGATLGERSVSNPLTHYDLLLSLSLDMLLRRQIGGAEAGHYGHRRITAGCRPRGAVGGA